MLSSSLRIFGGRGDGIGHETPFTPKVLRAPPGLEVNPYSPHKFNMEPTLWLCQNSYWKWWFIVDFPINNGHFQ